MDDPPSIGHQVPIGITLNVPDLIEAIARVEDEPESADMQLTCQPSEVAIDIPQEYPNMAEDANDNTATSDYTTIHWGFDTPTNKLAHSLGIFDAPPLNQLPDETLTFNASLLQDLAPCSFLHESITFPRCCKADLELWSGPDLDFAKGQISRFFEYINPHYPCSNESQFLSRLEEYLHGGNSNPSIEAIQLVAHVRLITALMFVLESQDFHSSEPPGWWEFKSATHLLSHAMSQARGDVNMIPCLIIKATYLLRIEDLNAAHEAVSQAVCLCYRTNLHNQPAWRDCSPFEVHIRQRIFWSLFCLERNINQLRCVPSLIAENEIRVDLPAMLDDRVLGHSERLPNETPRSSFGPYFHSTVMLTRLTSETWRAMFGAHAKRPIKEDFIAAMDAKAQQLLESLPEQLQWWSHAGKIDKAMSPPSFIRYQALLLRLRTNHLRLLLRRRDLAELSFIAKNDAICLSVASDSIDVIHVFHCSSLHAPGDRFFYLFYLTGALVALAGIMLSENQASRRQEDAVESFQKATNVMRSLASGLRVARTVLERLDNVLRAVAIKFGLTELRHEATTPPEGDRLNEMMFESDIWTSHAEGHNSCGGTRPELMPSLYPSYAEDDTSERLIYMPCLDSPIRTLEAED
ncbi:hypothetical protein EDB81DRAFT_934775 [Dactylonectria macrodidyma]|uniref:Xylanolytic transcriptional activator regulatory domain-containing protein n=1 Tax=Dactylonectria macrodidyma TaxID=307937 RepID=A0A9P9J6D0_9HYPO|nr:hypothetical protein EDB81DRAFT_934775 [Dactylonectria macrodidyma]